MSVVIETFLVCDSCGENFGVDSRHLHGYQQRGRAVKDGWFTFCGKDFCPECRAKLSSKEMKNFKKN